jgi:hypothetical protein
LHSLGMLLSVWMPITHMGTKLSATFLPLELPPEDGRPPRGISSEFCMLCIAEYVTAVLTSYCMRVSNLEAVTVDGMCLNAVVWWFDTTHESCDLVGSHLTNITPLARSCFSLTCNLHMCYAARHSHCCSSGT